LPITVSSCATYPERCNAFVSGGAAHRGGFAAHWGTGSDAAVPWRAPARY
jgi:hypothetical protein